MFATDAVRSVLVLVALSAVGRDRAEGVQEPGRDFRLRLRHWFERVEADPDVATEDERKEVKELLGILDDMVVLADKAWDGIQSWPELTDEF